MSRKLTMKQMKFTQEYLRSGNGTRAALKTYGTKDPITAASIAHENLRKPQIKEFIDGHAIYAAKRMGELMRQRKNLSISFQASKDILDRAGFKPALHPEKIENKFANMSNEELDKLLSDTLIQMVEKVKNEPCFKDYLKQFI